MVKNDLNKKRADKLAKQSAIDLLVNRSMLVFILAVIGVSVMLIAGKNISSQVDFIQYALPVLAIVSIVALVLSIIFFVRQKKSGKDYSSRVVTPTNLLGAAIGLALVLLVYGFCFDAMATIIAIIGACVLYFVFSFMRRDFTLYTGVMALGLVFFRAASVLEGKMSMLCYIAAAVVGVASIAVGIILAAGKGRVKLAGKTQKIGNGLIPMLIAGALLIAGAVIGLLGVSALSVYVIAVILAAYLATLVVYAIKMM